MAEVSGFNITEGNKARLINLLGEADGSGTVNGVWMELKDYRLALSLMVSGVVGETLVVCGSNAATKPANSAHGFAIGSTITADGFYDITTAPWWIKVRVSVAGTGTITAILAGSK